MSHKSIVITFVSVVAIIIVAGAISYWMYANQPMANVVPPVPPVPQRIALSTTDRPPVPPEPRIAGDAQDDGIVNGLDISVLVTNWQQKNKDYNLVDEASGEKYLLNALDISNVIKNWRCLELKKGCSYL